MLASSNRIVLCKVCGVVVPKRREYHPTVCEACQKFFRRCLKKVDKLQCINGLMACCVDRKTRRICDMCRFVRCRAAGMRSKQLSEDYFETATTARPATATPVSDTTPASSSSSRVAIADDVEITSMSDSSPHSAESQEVEEAGITLSRPVLVISDDNKTSLVVENSLASFKKPFPLLTRQPVLYDGASLEQISRTAVQAFTHLHGFEFMTLKRPSRPVEDPAIFLNLAKEQFAQTLSVAQAFGRDFGADCLRGLPDAEIDALSAAALPSLVAVFNNLTGNRGASLFGVDNSLAAKMISWFPQYQETKLACDKLSKALEDWNPSLIETSLLLAYLFFLDNKIQESRRIRRLSYLAFNLHLQAKFKDDQAAVDARRSYFYKGLQLTKEAVNQILNCVALPNQDEAPLMSWARDTARQLSTPNLPVNQDDLQ